MNKKNNIKEISGTKIKENRYKQNKGLDSINFEGSFKKYGTCLNIAICINTN